MVCHADAFKSGCSMSGTHPLPCTQQYMSCPGKQLCNVQATKVFHAGETGRFYRPGAEQEERLIVLQGLGHDAHRIPTVRPWLPAPFSSL